MCYTVFSVRFDTRDNDLIRISSVYHSAWTKSAVHRIMSYVGLVGVGFSMIDPKTNILPIRPVALAVLGPNNTNLTTGCEESRQVSDNGLSSLDFIGELTPAAHVRTIDRRAAHRSPLCDSVGVRSRPLRGAYLTLAAPLISGVWSQAEIRLSTDKYMGKGRVVSWCKLSIPPGRFLDCPSGIPDQERQRLS
ncbi:hypothetical protein J6590_011277 [Homalodisca vitripennis]|nr:hypothetical protein J6590_011277 [Homalodisca vitripennis]